MRSFIYSVVIALATLTVSAADWPTFGNNPQHTGYVNELILNGPFAAGWSAVVSNRPLQQVAISGGKVYATAVIYFDPTVLNVLNESDGSAAWSHTFANAFSLSAPTVDSGKVYVLRDDNSNDSQVVSFDANTGAQVWSSPYFCQWERPLAPTVANGTLYMDGGEYGGMYAFNAATGSQTFYAALPQYDGWTPTYYNNVIYSWVAGVFRAHDPSTGAVLWSTTVSTNTFASSTLNTAAPIANGMAYAIGFPNLYGIDLNSKGVAWTAFGNYSGTPAVANGVVYAITGQTVNAFDASTGELLLSYQAANNLQGQPIVTDDALLVASSTSTYVFNLATGNLVQTIGGGGNISLAGSKLYIGADTGTLYQYVAGAAAGPVVDSITGPSSVQLPSTVSLSATAHDPVAGSAITYTWSKLSGPGKATFSPNGTTGSATTTVSFDTSGQYVLKLTVSDAHGHNAASFAINALPTVVLDSLSVDSAYVVLPAGTTAHASAHSIANPQATLTYTWSKIAGPGSVTFSPNGSSSANVSAVHFNSAGKQVLQVSVFDGQSSTVGRIAVNTFVARAASASWPMWGNGPAHTGYVPGVKLNGAFAPAWSANITGTANPVCVGLSSVFVTNNSILSALDDKTGAELWRYQFNTANAINPPALDSGNIYVQRGNHGADSQLFSFNATTGQVNWSVPEGEQWERHYAPTIANGHVYVNSGYYGGMYGFNQSDGSQTFFDSSLPQYDQWTPCYYGGKLYSWVAGTFTEHDPLSGTALWSLNLSSGTPYSMNTVPAIDNGQAYMIGNPNLIAVNLAAHTQAWSVNGSFSGSPATANGVVYAIQGLNVNAYDANTGALLRTYAADTNLQGQPIITDNDLVVCSNVATYEFNLATGALYSKMPVGGSIVLAGTNLYLASSGTVQKLNSVQPPPIIDSFTATPGTVRIPTPSLLACTAHDPKNLPLTFSWSKTSGPGAVTFTSNGNANIVDASFDTPGQYTLTVTVSNGVSAPVSQDVQVTVLRLNHAPVALDQNFSIQPNENAQITLSATDADNDPLTYTTLSSPAHGLLFGSGSSVYYIPNLDFTGIDSFTFSANDGIVSGNTATITILVQRINHAPVAANQSASLLENGSVPITLLAVDADNDPLTYSTQSQPAHGTLTGSGSTLTYTPDAGYSGPDSFTFMATDGNKNSNVATVSIVVQPVPQPPVVLSAPLAIPSNPAVGDDVTFTVVAQSSDALTYFWDFGDGTLSSDGATVHHTFTAANTYTVSVTIVDETAGTSVNGSLTLTVNPAASNGGAGNPPPLTMKVSALSGAVNFHKADGDSFHITGVIPGVTAFNPAGATLTLNVSGAKISFTLDAKGHGKSAQGIIALKPNLKQQGKELSGDIAFTAQLHGGNWAAVWQMNPNASENQEPLTMDVQINLNGVAYEATSTVKYSSKAGVGGKFK